MTFGPLAAKQRRMREIVAVGDDLVRRRHLVEVALPAGQDDPGHCGPRSPRMMAARSPSRPNCAMFMKMA